MDLVAMTKVLTCDKCGGTVFHVYRTEKCELDSGEHNVTEVTIYDCDKCGSSRATWKEEK